MPISPVGRANRRAQSAGFTLVELLVVVTIVAILALGVGLTGGGVFARGASAPGSLASALREAVVVARDRAVLGRMTVGLHPRADGWIMTMADGAGTWQPLGRPVVARGAALRWQVDGAPFVPALAAPTPRDRPAVLFRADGGGTAFSLTVSDPGGRRTCRTDGWGPPRCE